LLIQRQAKAALSPGLTEPAWEILGDSTRVGLRCCHLLLMRETFRCQSCLRPVRRSL